MCYLWYTSQVDYVTVDDFRVRSTHGCNPREREEPQDFLVSLRVGFDAKAAGTSDDLSKTVDFRFLKQAVADVFGSGKRYLIETLAEDIAARILADSRVNEIAVSIKKPDVWDDGVPGVSITRTK